MPSSPADSPARDALVQPYPPEGPPSDGGPVEDVAAGPVADRPAAFAKLDLWTRWLAIIGFCGLVAIAVLTTWDGAARYLNLPRPHGLADYVSVVLALVVATCFPAGLLHRTNITVRFLGRGLGPRGATWPEAFGATVTLAFFAVLAWQAVRFTFDLQASGRTSSTIEMPVAPWWWVTTVVLILCVPVQAWVTGRLWAAALAGRPDPLPLSE